jgi:hypothetical protein
MGKKKKTKKNKAIASPLISPDESRYLESLLQDLKSISPENLDQQVPGPEFAEALLESLLPDDSESVRVASIIREHYKQKNVQKAVKKLIFRFKQKGVSILDSETDSAPSSILKPLQSAEPSVLLGVLDATGARGILIKIPQIPKGVDLGIGMVSGEVGIVHFYYARYSKKQAREIQNLFVQDTKSVDTTIQHAAAILETAYAKSKKGEATEGYLQIRPWILDHFTPLDHPIIYDFFPPENISGEVLTDSMVDKLMAHELFEAWIMEPDKIIPVIEEISKVEESVLVLSDIQKAERIREIKDQAINDLYSESERESMKDHLEEMAYMLYKLEGEEYARLSLLGAASLEQNTSFTTNVFLKALFDRSMNYYVETMGKQSGTADQGDRSSGLILP